MDAGLPGSSRTGLLAARANRHDHGRTRTLAVPRRGSGDDPGGGCSNLWLGAAADEEIVVPWRQWSAEAVQAAAQSGETVFVDFTAAYCTVCKANKAIAIQTSEVLQKIEKLGAVAFQGDFTSGDPEIAAVLRRYGRPGVPLNLIYPAGRPDDPLVLRPQLTKGYLLEKLDEAGPSRPQSSAGPEA